jgi:hypothetical protein
MTEMIRTRTLAPTGLERYGVMAFTDLPVALTLAIGRAAVTDVKRPPAANLVACARRAIAGMRVIPPSGGSRSRQYRVEDKERGGEGRDQNEMHLAHRSDPCECSLPRGLPLVEISRSDLQKQPFLLAHACWHLPLVTTRSHFCSQYFTHAALDLNWGWDKAGPAMPAKPIAITDAATAARTSCILLVELFPSHQANRGYACSQP